MHIIVCSKNPVVVDAASQVFQDRQPRLTVCESGLEVLGAVEVVNADLLILDMQTPGLNGLLMVSAIRELAPRLPIVAVSERSERDARVLSHKGVTLATLPPGDNGTAQALAAVLGRVEEDCEIGLPSHAGSK